MIATYAQASGRQGLDAALDGAAVDSGNTGFIRLREQVQALSDAKSISVEGIDVRYFRGVARLVFDDSDDDRDGSPITVVVEMNSEGFDLDLGATTVVASVGAIGRVADLGAIRAALQVAAEVHDSFVTRRRVVIAGGAFVVAGVIIVAAVLIAGVVPQR